MSFSFSRRLVLERFTPLLDFFLAANLLFFSRKATELAKHDRKNKPQNF